MRLNRRSAVLAIALFVTALGAGQALAARGGLSVTPGILEAAAQPGSVGGLKIANTTRRPMRVRVAVRRTRHCGIIERRERDGSLVRGFEYRRESKRRRDVGLEVGGRLRDYPSEFSQ